MGTIQNIDFSSSKKKPKEQEPINKCIKFYPNLFGNKVSPISTSSSETKEGMHIASSSAKCGESALVSMKKEQRRRDPIPASSPLRKAQFMSTQKRCELKEEIERGERELQKLKEEVAELEKELKADGII